MTFEQENKQLANDFLERFYYREFKNFNKTFKKLEIFLLGQCTANCEYCYLKKNSKFLYPADISNHQTILNNLKKTLNWYIQNQFNCDIELFSAEWLTTPIMEPVFELMYEKFSNTEYKPYTINMADNMLFIRYPEIVKKIEYYINKFQQDLNIHLVFSASIDGKYCDFGRTEEDDEFYDNVFKFILNHKFGFHPMISATNIPYWIDNYKWFEEKLGIDRILNIMTLEVRNDNWTNESIQHLITFCDFLTDRYLEYFNGNLDEIFRYVTNADGNVNNYVITGLKRLNPNHITCRKQLNLTIRMGDLSVGPCHRLFYPQLLAGYFDSNDETLLEFVPQNIENYIISRKISRNNLPYCDACEWITLCPGHCHGVSYETQGNEYVPPKSICNLYKAKYSFLLYKYSIMGLFNETNLEKLGPKFTTLLQNTLAAIVEGEQNE